MSGFLEGRRASLYSSHDLSFIYFFADGKMSFADFLEVMHEHSQRENIPEEIKKAFRAFDTSRKGVISARDLRHVLLRWGEKLSPREGAHSCL